MATIARTSNAPRMVETVFCWLAISLIFSAIFLKDIISFYFLDYARRNTYGSVVAFSGLILAIVIAIRLYGSSIFTLLSDRLLLSWSFLLFVIAPLTSIYFGGNLFVSPQALGFAAAAACYVTSPRITKNVLIITLAAQLVALLFEYHSGLSLTLTANEAQNILFNDQMWFIDPAIGLIRAKGFLDSTHDSTWLFLYAALIFNLAPWVLVSALAAAWMAQGRLAILAVSALIPFGRRAPRVLATVAALVVAAFVIYPQKMMGGIYFFLGAFDSNSNSNLYRAEATASALNHLAGTSGGAETPGSLTFVEFWITRIVGHSGSSLGAGTIPSEMGYTLFGLEYGALGLILIFWTVFVVFQRNWRESNRSGILLGALFPVLMLSSAVQSASTFFMLWLTILYLGRVIVIEPDVASLERNRAGLGV